MIENRIYYLGLSRVELQCIRSRFPISFQLVPFAPEDLEDEAKTIRLVSTAWCVFVNPKKLNCDQLEHLIYRHENAICHTHAVLLLFTDSFTREQKHRLHTEDLRQINLHSRLDRPLRDAAEIARKGTMPCWDHLKRIEANMFNDAWYLIDMETSGSDPLEDDILCISIARMAAYEIQCEWKFYIRQMHPISEELEKETGITNEMLEHGISKEEVVKFLHELPFPALILESEKYDLPFLKALFHLCGDRFDLPFVAIDGLAAIAFANTGCRRARDVLQFPLQRRLTRTPVDCPELARLYDLTLAVFENLQDRYDVRAPGHFSSLYAAEIQGWY